MSVPAAIMPPSQQSLPTDSTGNPTANPPPYELPTTEDTMVEFQARMQWAMKHSHDWRTEARDLYDFEAGKQWDEQDEKKLKDQSRPMVTFNLMSKFIDAVVGLQINNRQDIRCYPRNLGQTQVNELATGALAWCRDACDAEYEDTEAGHDCLLTGMGWIEDFLDDRFDPEGTVRSERRDPLEMFWDPRARKKNLSDRRWQCRLKRVRRDEYVELFGEEPTGSVVVPGLSLNDPEPGMQIIERPQDYESSPGGAVAYGYGYVVADYQFSVVHTYWQVHAQFPEGSAIQHFSDTEWKDTEQQMKDAKVPHKADRVKQIRFYRCWITGSGVGEIRPLSFQEGFTFHAITGKRDRNKNTWFGLGRNLRDPQRWVNAFFSSIIWQLMVNPKGGMMAEEDAFENQADAEDSWADPSKITWASPGAITSGKIQPKPASGYPEGMDRLMSFSMDALPGVSGINAELLGLTQQNQPGVVEAQRKQGALAIIAWYFDALRLYYKQSGRCLLSLIRDFIADGRLIRIAGDQGAQYVQLLKDPLTQKFDIIVDEAPTSVNMKERVGTVLMEIVPMAIQAQLRVPPEVIDYLPLPADLAQKWKQLLQSPPPPEAQMAGQLELRQKAAKAARDEGAAVAHQATAQLDTVKAEDLAASGPVSNQLDHVETLRKAAETGVLMAGGGGAAKGAGGSGTSQGPHPDVMNLMEAVKAHSQGTHEVLRGMADAIAAHRSGPKRMTGKATLPSGEVMNFDVTRH